MQEDINRILQNFSIEAVIIGAVVFALTMLLKQPLKKKTALLSEEKRKAVNSLIVLIPIAAALIIGVGYYGLAKKEWFSALAFKTAVSAWLLSFSFYAIFSRLGIIVKGFIAGKITTQDVRDAALEMMEKKEKSFDDVTNSADVNANELSDKITAITELLSRLENAAGNKDVAQIARANEELYVLTEQQKKAESKLASARSQTKQ